MKNLIIAIIGTVLVGFYFSCKKENMHLYSNEESLIEQIIAAPQVEALSVADLPPAILAYVKQNHAPFDIEMVFHAPELGYEVILENGLCTFFGMNGNHLNHDGMHNDLDNNHGTGDNHCMMGDTLNVADLPQTALNYIAGNYAGNNVVTVVVKPSGKLGVELSSGAILMFSSVGNFIKVCDSQGGGGHHHAHGNNGGPGWHCDPTGPMGGHHGGMGMGNHSGSNGPCWGGTGIPVDSLPAAITGYIGAKHLNATVVQATRTFSGKYFLRLSDCARLVFDENGNILFDSGE